MQPTPLILSATCLTAEGRHLLAFEAIPREHFPAFGPPVYLRFGFAPSVGQDYLIPRAALEDHGLEIAAPEVYEWIETRGTLFPRADVFGLTPDSRPAERFMKELDLAARPLAFAARTPDEFPGLRLSLWLGAGPTEAPLPAPLLMLLERALPRYTLTEADGSAPLAKVVARAIGER